MTPSSLTFPSHFSTSKQQKFSDALQQHRSGLLRFAVRLARGNRELGADLLQDAVLLSYRSYAEERSDPLPYFRSWMFKIIRNVAHRKLEKEHRYICEEDILAVVDAGSSSPSPWQQLDAEQIDQRILDALGLLPDPQRQCVILIDVHQLDYEEAARFLGVPTGTVRSRISRARAKLGQILAPHMAELM